MAIRQYVGYRKRTFIGAWTDNKRKTGRFVVKRLVKQIPDNVVTFSWKDFFPNDMIFKDTIKSVFASSAKEARKKLLKKKR